MLHGAFPSGLVLLHFSAPLAKVFAGAPSKPRVEALSGPSAFLYTAVHRSDTEHTELAPGFWQRLAEMISLSLPVAPCLSSSDTIPPIHRWKQAGRMREKEIRLTDVLCQHRTSQSLGKGTGRA